MVKCTKRQIRQLKTALHWKMPEAQRQRIQMILLRESGMAQPAIADAMGVSLSTVNRAHMAYDHGGIKALKPKPSGGRKRENMTLAEEKTLLRRFAKAAGAGEMLNIHDLKAAYGPRQAAYDLKKLRGKQIVHRIGATHRYQPIPSGLRAITALLVLRDKAIKPLLAAAQEITPTHGAQNPRAIDRHYHDLRHAMQGVFHELGIAA